MIDENSTKILIPYETIFGDEGAFLQISVELWQIDYRKSWNSPKFQKILRIQNRIC